jgi:hypothetical protein
VSLVRTAPGSVTAPARGIGIDGDKVADLGNTFDVVGDLLHSLLLLLGVHLAPDIGHPFVDLDVEARYVQRARVLADPRPDAVLDLLLLLGNLAYVSPVPPADEWPGGRI